MADAPDLIYLDTSIVSAYFDERARLRQADTQLFWGSKGVQFVVSWLVYQEIERTPNRVKRDQMIDLIQGLPLLRMTPALRLLALDFVQNDLVPARKLDDAQHLALAVAHGMDFLVSWNFRHMVTRKTIQKLPMLAAKNGYFKQVIVTSPMAFVEELREERDDEPT